MSQNVIELNGKRYDAITGAYLGTGSQASKAKAVAAQKPVHGKVVDGFVRPVHAAHHKSAAAPHKPAPAKPHSAEAKPAHHELHSAKPTGPKQEHKAKTSRAPAPHKPAHKPQHSQTLMRRAVHKPKIEKKPAIKPQLPAELMAQPASAIARKRSVYDLDKKRLERATSVPKHEEIVHFQSVGPAGIGTQEHHIKKTAHVPVIPVKPAAKVAVPQRHALPLAEAKPADIFEAALAHANSHEQPKHHHAKRRSRRRLVNIMAGVGAFLVIGGFISYLNMPGIELRVASMQAGFHASIPDYQPTGYALKEGVKRSGNVITMSFRSGDSNYTLTQQASDWNSQTLLDSTLALSGAHTTVQKNGQTIYIYDGANAAWVNGGVRYDLTGNASLSTDDIVAIATSL